MITFNKHYHTTLYRDNLTRRAIIYQLFTLSETSTEKERLKEKKIPLDSFDPERNNGVEYLAFGFSYY